MQCIGALIGNTVLLVQCALRVLHITCHSLEDNPCSTDGCEEGSWNRTERVEVAAIDDPADHID